MFPVKAWLLASLCSVSLCLPLQPARLSHNPAHHPEHIIKTDESFLREINAGADADQALKAEDLSLVMTDPDFMQWIYFLRNCPVLPEYCQESRGIMKRIVSAMRNALGRPWDGKFKSNHTEKRLILDALDEMNATSSWLNEHYIQQNVTWSSAWGELAEPGETWLLSPKPKEPYIKIPGPWPGISTNKTEVVAKALSFGDMASPGGDGYLIESELVQYLLACNWYAARYGDMSTFWTTRCWFTSAIMSVFPDAHILDPVDSCAIANGTIPYKVKVKEGRLAPGVLGDWPQPFTSKFQ